MPLTLAQFRARAAARLIDASNVLFSTATLDEAIQSALDEYSEVYPYTYTTLLVLEIDGREINLGDVTGLVKVTSVQWPFDSDDETYPRPFVAFNLSYDDAQPVLYLYTNGLPVIDDEVLVTWAGKHTIQNLDSASTTTVRPDHETVLVTGAAGYAAMSRAIELNETDPSMYASAPNYGAISAEYLKQFKDALTKISQREIAHAPQVARWTIDKWDE